MDFCGLGMGRGCSFRWVGVGGKLLRLQEQTADSPTGMTTRRQLQIPCRNDNKGDNCSCDCKTLLGEFVHPTLRDETAKDGAPAHLTQQVGGRKENAGWFVRRCWCRVSRGSASLRGFGRGWL